LAWDNLFSRTVWLFLQPGNLIFFFTLAGVILIWRGRRTAGLSILIPAMIVYLLIMFGPLTNWLMVPLENRFAGYTNDVSDGPYSGIIVLGGAERMAISTDHQQVSLDGAAERLIMAAMLARKFPALPIIYSGGARFGKMMTEVQIARKFFRGAGIDLSRIRFDGKSYNTYTNAVESKKLIRKNETGKWFLVTSAFHMPRAVGVFRTAGINIQPYPVDYRSGRAITIGTPNMGHNLYQLDYAVHEWVGLVAYYISGHSNRLFPAP